MKTIEVSYDALVKHVYMNCSSYFYNFQEGECCLKKVTKQTCSLHVFADDLHCPLDCPRLNAQEYGCDKGRCSKVKAIIKGMKA